jgi:hypothetical protein
VKVSSLLPRMRSASRVANRQGAADPGQHVCRFDDEGCVWNIRVDWQNEDEAEERQTLPVAALRRRTKQFVPRGIVRGRGWLEEEPFQPPFSRRIADDDEFVLCKRKRLCYTQPRANERFAFSSVAQR